MDTSAKGLNVQFPIYKADGTPFEGLVLHKSAFESVVMSLGDKITGDVYYKDNTLAVKMQEYIVYEGVHYALVTPPTIVREGLVKDNSEAKGLTKYSFTFYHPMYMLGNFEFTDVAVKDGEERYLAQNKTFSWIGYLRDFVDKLNANLAPTEWTVRYGIDFADDKLSEVLSFDNNFVSDALKKAYETWKKPFTIQKLSESDTDYQEHNKRYAITFGMPNERIEVDGEGGEKEEYVFKLGQGVGLKNNSRTPKNNKIITRISGYGSENNIPWGYPQIVWYGDQTWDYTIDNNKDNPLSYPIYDGIVNGQKVRLIKHPFTRNHLMPSFYSQTVFNKVSPYLERQLPDGALIPNPDYDPETPIIDYYEADGSYPNPINPSSPSYEIHQFEDIKPELGGDVALVSNAEPYTTSTEGGYITIGQFNDFLIATGASTSIAEEKDVLLSLIPLPSEPIGESIGGAYTYRYEIKYLDAYFLTIKYESSGINFTKKILYANDAPEPAWDDTMDDDGNYLQSYFKLTLPQLSFDIYACASITEEMKINMRSGACIGCTFPIMVDWEDYKKNFYDSDGNFDPAIDEGHPRNADKYPDSSQGSITVICQKEYETFGTIMPNVYQQPKQGDLIVFLGISLPQSYIANAETRLDNASKQYMLENNVHYYDYPLKFDEYFLANNLDILGQIHNNTRIKFQFGGESTMALFVKQINIKWGDSVLPQYDITLTDDIEVVINQIGQVTEDVSALRVQMSEIQKYYAQNLVNDISSRLSRIQDDIALGKITFQQGLESIGSLILHSEIRSDNYIQGMTDQGRGWRIDELGNAEVESIRVRSFMEVLELLVNRLQAQEGDTAFSDNDQIDYVEEIEYNGETCYRLTFKEKWKGYFTSQVRGNILKGVANTLAANLAHVSEVEDTEDTEHDGSNSYFTSWMQVVATHSEDNTLGNNQVVVVLYDDDQVPSGTNFEPCELMTVVRWGNTLSVNEQGITDGEKERRRRLQRSFVLSNTDGRITKLVGVTTPILTKDNYGTTLGTLPDWVVSDYTEVGTRYKAGRDYLYTQGIVVRDFIKIDNSGSEVPNYIDKGQWVIGTEYFSEIAETDDVWYDGQYWRCTQHHVATAGNYPQANSRYWALLIKRGADGTSFTSKGQARGHYATFTALQQDLPTIQPNEGDLFLIDDSSDYYEGYEAPTVMVFVNAPDYTWQASLATEGDGYMVNGSLFVANETYWADMGSIQGAKGDDGVSAFMVDLDNETDSVRVNANDELPFDYVRWIKIRAFYGASNVLQECTLVASSSTDDIDVDTTQFKTNGIKISVDAFTTLTLSNTITFTLSHPTYGSRTALFTLNAIPIADGEDAVIYSLVPSVKEVVKKKDGAYIPTAPITCAVTKNTGGAQSVPSTSEYRLYKILNNGTRTLITTADQTTPSDITANLIYELEIQIASQSWAVVDRETIPLLEDGIDASEVRPNILLRTLFDNTNINAIKQAWEWSVSNDYVYIDPNADTIVQGRRSIRLDASTLSSNAIDFQQDVYGKLKPSTWYTLSFHYFSTSDFNTFLWNTDDTKPSCIDTQAGIYVDGVWRQIGGDGNVLWSGNWNGDRHTITFKTNSVFYTNHIYMLFRIGAGGVLCLCMPKLEEGVDATAYIANESDLVGKMGKNYYYGGDWNTSRLDTFTANDQETPYFVNNENKYVYVGDNFTNLTIAQIFSEKGAPSATNPNWQIMVTDFKYLISEAIFAQFAKLGSFVISGDWMISQNGTVNGVASNAYNLFDPQHPNDNTGTNFIPSYAVDGLTGKAYINDANVAGTVYADKGEFQGLMQNSMYSPWHDLADIQDKSYDNNVITIGDNTYKIYTDVKNAGRILRFSSYDFINGTSRRGSLVLQGNDIDPQTGNPINTEYFYYHGIAIQQLYLNYGEVVELLGIGSSTKFWGWIVLDKKRIRDDEGLPLNVFVKASIRADGVVYSSAISDSRGKFTVERLSTGTYRITLPNALLSEVLIINGGVNTDDKRFVFFSSQKTTTINDLQHPYFIAQTTDISGNNVDCAFNFFVYDTSRF